jgi:hypothetical protein
MIELRQGPVPPSPWPQAAGHLLPALGQNRVDGLLRDAVAGDLLLAQHRLKLAHQVGRTHDLLAQPAQKLHRPRVHHRDIHDGVVGRVLHGDRGAPKSIASRPAASSCQLEYSPLAPGSESSRPLLDAMHQLARLALAGTK